MSISKVSAGEDQIPRRHTGSYNNPEFANMVMEVNRTEVDPLIQLDAVAYIYDLETDQISIGAEA